MKERSEKDRERSWYSAAGYGWSGSYGSWYGRRREVRSDVEWFCQKCGTGNWWSRADCRHCASVTNDAADAPQTSVQEKIAVLEKTLAGMGNDEPILAGNRVLEKELEKLHKETQWFEEHCKAHRGQAKLDQKRIQTHRVQECKAGGDAREPQSTKSNFESGLRGDQDSPRGPAARRRIDGQKQEPYHVSGEHGRNPNPLNNKNWLFGEDRLRRDLLDGRDGSVEEIAGWMLEAHKLNRDVEAKKRKLHGSSGWLSVVVRVQTRILRAISEWKRLVEEKEFGTVECCELSWNVAGLFPVADFDAHRLGRFVVARMFRKIGWSERWCSRIVHAVRTLGRIAMPSSHRESEMERTIEDCRGCGKRQDGLRSSWMDR